MDVRLPIFAPVLACALAAGCAREAPVSGADPATPATPTAIPAPVSADAAGDTSAARTPDAAMAVGDPAQDGAQPDSLLAAGLVDSAARDDAVRALLGDADYRRLLDTASLSTPGDAPGLVLFNVRGLDTVMEAALQQDGDALRVALIAGDEVRWYSSDAATRSAPPAWFDAWRARFADTPVRLMSAPGQPRLPATPRG